MAWKPREEYKTLAEFHKPILTRNKGGWPGPTLSIWSEGHFLVCPGVPMYYGRNQCGWLHNDSFDEWMEIPE